MATCIRVTLLETSDTPTPSYSYRGTHINNQTYGSNFVWMRFGVTTPNSGSVIANHIYNSTINAGIPAPDNIWGSVLPIIEQETEYGKVYQTGFTVTLFWETDRIKTELFKWVKDVSITGSPNGGTTIAHYGVIECDPE